MVVDGKLVTSRWGGAEGALSLMLLAIKRPSGTCPNQCAWAACGPHTLLQQLGVPLPPVCTLNPPPRPPPQGPRHRL